MLPASPSPAQHLAAQAQFGTGAARERSDSPYGDRDHSALLPWLELLQAKTLLAVGLSRLLEEAGGRADISYSLPPTARLVQQLSWCKDKEKKQPSQGCAEN